MRQLGFKLRKSSSLFKIEDKPEIKPGSFWIAQTSRGTECGQVNFYQYGCCRVPREIQVIKLLRPADENDLASFNKLESLEQEVLKVSLEKIKNYHLGIKIISAEVLFDHCRLILHYKELEKKAAKGRNFKDFLRDLEETFKMRAEGKEVGAKAEAKIFSGLGICGQTLCCSGWLPKPKSISVKLVKDQDLSLNLNKFTGCCGCLMCCLSYEHEMYKEGVFSRKEENKKVGKF